MVGGSVTMRGMEVTLEVDGWPPTNAEAKSLLAADHPHAERVRALLRAAQAHGWTTTAADIGLDLVVRGPARPASDATNYLGAVGDVLQEKVSQHNLNVSHLADLAMVALYVDDRQIREIRYAEELSPAVLQRPRLRGQRFRPNNRSVGAHGIRFCHRNCGR